MLLMSARVGLVLNAYRVKGLESLAGGRTGQRVIVPRPGPPGRPRVLPLIPIRNDSLTVETIFLPALSPALDLALPDSRGCRVVLWGWPDLADRHLASWS